jgi:phosphatidate cytidylyltransferase
MAFDVKTFLTRLGSAFIFSLIMMAALLMKEWAFIGLFFVVNILCLNEYSRIVELILQTTFTRNEKVNFIAIGVAIFGFVVALPMTHCDNQIAGYASSLVYHFAGFVIGTLLIFFIFKKNKKALYLLSGLGYISAALGFLVQLRFQSLYLPLLLILFIWMNDSMAYLTGSFIGRTAFFPSISPKKTWEGTIGGILFTMAFAYSWGSLTNWFPMSVWILFGLTAGVVGTAGDLVESKLKRLAGVKDSGAIMPGHGGALDRFDSLLLSAPFALLITMLYKICKQVIVF